MITIQGQATQPNLMLFDMLDFDTILGIDQLASYCVVLYHYSKTIAFTMPNELLVLVWQGSIYHILISVIYYVQARRLVAICYLVFLAHVYDMSAQAPSISLVLVIYEYLDMFFANFPCLPPKRDVHLTIDLILGTKLIFITLYRMALIELKKINVQL